MKIAVPTVGDQVDQHFGHCEKFSVYTIENQKIATVEFMEPPAGCGCKSNMATKLAESGVQLLIAGGIGNGAVNVLASNGIETIKGASGPVREAVEAFLQGQLRDRGDICRAHGSDHECGH